jgi:hypothetical protein
MQVKDLIEQLQDMDPELEVHFEYGYGDYWRTQVAPKVSTVDVGTVAYSEYHRMDKIVEPDWDDEEDEPKETLRSVVLIG